MSDGIRLGVVTPHPPTTGTLNEYGLHLVDALADTPEVAEVVVLADRLPEGAAFPDRAGIDFTSCWSFNDWRAAIRIVRAARAAEVDTLLFNVQFATFGDRRVPAALGLLTPLLARMAGLRTIVLLHNIMETIDLEGAGFGAGRVVEAVVRMAGTLVTWFVLRADLVAVTMPQYVEVLRTKYRAGNVAVVPHGTFDVPLQATPAVPDGPARLLAFGKFGTYQKVEMLVEAARLLSDRHEVQVVIAGSDSPNAPGYLDGIAATTGDLDVVFTGYVAEEEVAELFASAAVAVFPYVATTGSSGVVHQAASCARSLVMPDIGDFRRLVEAEGYEGEWFDPTDPATLAEAIGRLLDDVERRELQGLRNHAVSSGLPMSDVADWYLDHVEHLQAA